MKDKNHVHELLSAFADGELPGQQAKTVDEHLSGCSECREHLADLRSLSKMLSGMPKKDLPPGFMPRLKARQLRQAASEAESRRFPFFAWPLPDSAWRRHFLAIALGRTQPVRATAMALSALVVMFVAYEGLRNKGGPQLPAPSSAVSVDEAQMALGPKAAAFRGKAKAMSGIAAFATRGSAGGAASPSAAPAPQAPALAGGAPLGEAPQPRPSYTNEELQAMIEAEKKRMGITAIIPPQEDSFSSDDPMMGMARADRLNNAAKRAPARLEGDTPAIITPTSLQAPSEAGRVALGPTVGPGTRTFSPVKAGRQARVSDLMAGPAGGGAGGQALEDDLRTFGSLSVAAARSREELDRLWASHNIALPKPNVDFNRQMVVLIPPSEEDNSACDIVSVEEAGASLLVRCRRHESSYAERPTAVSFRVVPARNLPLKLEPFK
ncbi:MAG: zf-HC2 domain-containing protein [Elusimicrobia bacterium]|nr:zf-HC2 domain-containing protein [Elusimicrobiota bacterium]